MPIAIDASTPANVQLATSTSATATTASFSPPAKSLVVIHVTIGFDANTPSAPSFTVADSGSTSYTAGPTGYDGGATGVWLFSHYYATAPGAITVTATRTGQLGAAMFFVKTWVLTGAAASQTGAASASGHAQTGTSISGSITPTQLNSWVMVGGASGSNIALNAAGGLTQDTSWADASDGEATASGHLVVSSVSAQSPGWTVASNIFWSWAALEILPAGVTFDAVGPSSSGSTSSTATGTVLTWTHTAVASGVAIVVGFAYGHGTGAGSVGTIAVTCDGNPMTQIGLIENDNQSSSTTGGSTSLWGIANQSSGAHTIAVTVTGGATNLRTNVAGSVSYSGADTVSPFGAGVTNFGSSAAPAVTVTGTAASSMVAGVASCGNATVVNPSTSRWVNNFSPSNAAGNAGQADTAGGGSITLTWSSGNDWWGTVGVEIVVPAAAGNPSGITATAHRPSKSRLRYHHGARRQRIQAAFGVPTPAQATLLPVVASTPPTPVMDGSVWLWHS